MRIQSQIIIAIICINAAIAFGDSLGALGVLPGYDVAHSLSVNGTSTEAAMVQYGNGLMWLRNGAVTANGYWGSWDIVGSLPSSLRLLLMCSLVFPASSSSLAASSL
jgi:hypothetical protein